MPQLEEKKPAAGLDAPRVDPAAGLLKRGKALFDMIFCDGNPKTKQPPCDFWKEGRYPGVDECLNFARFDGYGFVRHGQWDTKPPRMFCERVRQLQGNSHICEFYKPKRETKGDTNAESS